MEKLLICLDTSVLIDCFRQKDKTKSFFYAMASKYDSFAVSAITEYEIYIGSNAEQDKNRDFFLKKVIVLPYDSQVNKIAIDIFTCIIHVFLLIFDFMQRLSRLSGLTPTYAEGITL